MYMCQEGGCGRISTTMQFVMNDPVDYLYGTISASYSLTFSGVLVHIAPRGLLRAFRSPHTKPPTAN